MNSIFSLRGFAAADKGDAVSVIKNGLHRIANYGQRPNQVFHNLRNGEEAFGAAAITLLILSYLKETNKSLQATAITCTAPNHFYLPSPTGRLVNNHQAIIETYRLSQFLRDYGVIYLQCPPDRLERGVDPAQVQPEVVQIPEDLTLTIVVNNVTLHVRADSHPELLCRDWMRAVADLIDDRVGPAVQLVLSEAEQLQFYQACGLIFQSEHREDAAGKVAQLRRREVARWQIENAPKFIVPERFRRSYVVWQEGMPPEQRNGRADFTTGWARLILSNLGTDRDFAKAATQALITVQHAYGEASTDELRASAAILGSYWEYAEPFGAWWRDAIDQY